MQYFHISSTIPSEFRLKGGEVYFLFPSFHHAVGIPALARGFPLGKGLERAFFDHTVHDASYHEAVGLYGLGHVPERMPFAIGKLLDELFAHAADSLTILPVEAPPSVLLSTCARYFLNLSSKFRLFSVPWTHRGRNCFSWMLICCSPWVNIQSIKLPKFKSWFTRP